MDICGEYSEAHDLIEAQKAGLLNEHTNVEILEEVKLEGLQSPSLEIGSTGTLNGYSPEYVSISFLQKWRLDMPKHPRFH